MFPQPRIFGRPHRESWPASSPRGPRPSRPAAAGGGGGSSGSSGGGSVSGATRGVGRRLGRLRRPELYSLGLFVFVGETSGNFARRGPLMWARRKIIAASLRRRPAGGFKLSLDLHIVPSPNLPGIRPAKGASKVLK